MELKEFTTDFVFEIETKLFQRLKERAKYISYIAIVISFISLIITGLTFLWNYCSNNKFM